MEWRAQILKTYLPALNVENRHFNFSTEPWITLNNEKITFRLLLWLWLFAKSSPIHCEGSSGFAFAFGNSFECHYCEKRIFSGTILILFVCGVKCGIKTFMKIKNDYEFDAVTNFQNINMKLKIYAPEKIMILLNFRSKGIKYVFLFNKQNESLYVLRVTNWVDVVCEIFYTSAN